MRFTWLAFGLILAIGVPVHAADFVMSMAGDTWPAGDRVRFSVFATAVPRDSGWGEFPETLPCTLTYGKSTDSVRARRIPPASGGDGVAPAGAPRADYEFDLPRNAVGTVRLSVPLIAPVPLVFIVSPEAAQTAPGEAYPTLDSLFTLYQPYLGNIAAYKPMYFLVGTDPEKSKFQISFKYRLFNPASDFVKDYPAVEGIHFAYTQTSFWDLKSNSAPFKDTSYKPEMFWISPNLNTGRRAMTGLFFQTGFQHESNGRGGGDSRSTNFLYLQPVAVFFDHASRYGLAVAPKVWVYVDNDDVTNADLSDYRGYFELDLKFGRADSVVLGTTFRWAEKGASVQADLTYPLHRFTFQALDIYLQLQYVDALAENLLNYRERDQAFRIGLSIVR